jgi:hypothetical protein
MVWPLLLAVYEVGDMLLSDGAVMASSCGDQLVYVVSHPTKIAAPYSLRRQAGTLSIPAGNIVDAYNGLAARPRRAFISGRFVCGIVQQLTRALSTRLYTLNLQSQAVFCRAKAPAETGEASA